MRNKLLTQLLLLVSIFGFGQESDDRVDKDIGVNYFGELGFRPGLEIDYGFNVWKKEKEKEKRVLERKLNLRPSVAYYRYSHYSNNFLSSLKLNYQFDFKNKQSGKHFFIEPFIQAGYLRYFLKGDVFETSENGFEEVRFSGSNSFIVGNGFDVGGYLTKRADWLFGFDYFAEFSQDNLVLHRFVAKLGARIKLKSK